MRNKSNDHLNKIFKALDKNLQTKEDPNSTASKELIEQLPEFSFKTHVASGLLIDLLANNGNMHTQRAAYKKFANEDKIFVAACFGWKKTLAKLLEKQSDVNVALPSGETLLYLAAKYGKKSTLSLLLARNANVNYETVLHAIIKDDNYDALEARMRGQGEVDPYITSPLCAATEGKHYEVMEQLLIAKAKVNQRSLFGKVLDSGTKTDNSNAYLSIGIIKGKNPSYNDEESYTYSAMHIAAKNDDVNALALLQEYGANVNQSARMDQFSSSTPLHVAVQAGSVNAVNYLIKNKADVNRKAIDFIVSHYHITETNLGLTPLHIAAKQGDTRIITLLLDNGAGINTRGMHTGLFSPKPNTPLDLAAMSDNLEAFDLISANGGIVEDWDTVLDRVITDYAHYFKHLEKSSTGPSNQIELLKRLLARQEKPVLNYKYLLELALKSTSENHYTPNFAVANELLSYTKNWDPALKVIVARNELDHLKLLLERKDRPSINFDKYLSLALKPTYENKDKPDVMLIQTLIAQGATVTQEQIEQTQKNGLDYLIEPLTAAKAEQDKASKQKPVGQDSASKQKPAAQESTPVKVGFFRRAFGGCCGVTTAALEHGPG